MSEKQGQPSSARSLRAIVGTGRREVGCEECFERLHSYVEARLAGRDPETVVPGLRAHLDGCPACREEHASVLALARRHARPGAG